MVVVAKIVGRNLLIVDGIEDCPGNEDRGGDVETSRSWENGYWSG